MVGEQNFENKESMWEGKIGTFLMTGRDLEGFEETKILTTSGWSDGDGRQCLL